MNFYSNQHVSFGTKQRGIGSHEIQREAQLSRERREGEEKEKEEKGEVEEKEVSDVH